MSYGRDRDANSRGVGAIASRDMAHPQAVRRRQIAKARATNARDRLLAGVTYGPVGGIAGGLGALNTATNTVGGLTGGVRRPILVRGGKIEGGGMTTLQTAVKHLSTIPPVTPPKPTPPNPIFTAVQNAAAITSVLATPSPTRPTKTPTPTRPSKGLPGSRPPPKPLPTPLPEPRGAVTGGGSSSGGASTSGGGGGGGGDPVDETPIDVPDVEPATSSAMSSGKKVAIGVGIAAALYLLLQGDS